MKHNILLIDDDIDEFTFITSILEHFPGVNFHYASTVATGLKMMHMQLPDAVMLDINMPVTNGLQCLESLKKDPSLANVPVIIYSTCILQEVKNKVMEDGAALCIEKPKSIDEIKHAIEKVLQITANYNAWS